MITKKIIQEAAKLIQQGDLVAFPTETVYGLGADALNPKAVLKIFKAKGRPSDNPLIVHITDLKDLKILAKNIPKETYILAKKFWPGPITFVLKKQKIVPYETTAGLETVAIRMPKHKIAKELIKLSKTPIAAPSANKSGRPSPTDAKTVFEDFGNEIQILDGGKTKIGLESTVLDLSEKPFTLLRKGAISKEEIEKAINQKIHPYRCPAGASPSAGASLSAEASPTQKSPGLKYKHYAPKAPLFLLNARIPIRALPIPICANSKCLLNAPIPIRALPIPICANSRIGILCSNETTKYYKDADLIIKAGSKKNLKKIAQNLFSNLRKFDQEKIDIIISESFEEKGIGIAIMDRLRRAATKII